MSYSITPYRLLLIGSFTYPAVFSSCEFFSHELGKRFALLGNVELECRSFDDTSPYRRADIVLIHSYFDRGCYRQLDQIRTETRCCKVVSFMELAHERTDHSYVYSCEIPDELKLNCSHIELPVVKKYYRLGVKKENSILLDHLWPGGTNELHHELWSVLESLQEFYDIAQLQRLESESIPAFIRRIPLLPHPDYLEATAEFERFIVTHIGSYNHTAVDMAMQGAQIFVPYAGGRSFVPKNIVELLGMKLFHTSHDIPRMLKEPSITLSVAQAQNCGTDLDDIVIQLDQDFQKWTWGCPP